MTALLDWTFVAIKRRRETSRHSGALAFSRLIAQLTRHAGAAAGASVWMIATRPIGMASQTHPVSPQAGHGMTFTVAAGPQAFSAHRFS
jgi:hypothetical protein